MSEMDGTSPGIEIGPAHAVGYSWTTMAAPQSFHFISHTPSDGFATHLPEMN
jgi:hypothetical protein